MPYVTQADMLTLFEEYELIEATNLRDPQATSVNGDRLNQACAGASGIIDGWLMRRYKIPLENPTAELNEALKMHAAIIAMYMLDGSDETIRKKYEDTIEWLKTFTDAPAAGTGGDTTPGVDVGERFGSISYGAREGFWNESRAAALFWGRTI